MPGPLECGTGQDNVPQYIVQLCRAIGLGTLLLCSSALMAQTAQQNRSRAFAPGTCGPVDPTYIRTAEATGGIPFFFQRSEVAQATKFMMASTGNNRVTVLWAKGTLQNSSRDVLVPIDSTLTNVVFTLSADNRETKLEVFDPNNNGITADPQTDITEFTCGRYITIKNPSAGSYRLHLTGSGRYWLSVAGKSEIFLYAVEFVERGGRLGHEGMFPIHGQPVFGKSSHLQATMAGPAKHIAFQLMTPEAQPLKTIEVKSVHDDDDDHEFVGTVNLPAEPFRIVATGTDENGHHFQRMHEALVSPSVVSIALIHAEDLHAGRTSSFAFRVTNLGNSENFKLVAVCANGWPTHADRPSVTLSREENVLITITVSVPAGTSVYTGADLILTATGEGDPNVSNSFVQRLSVEP